MIETERLQSDTKQRSIIVHNTKNLQEKKPLNLQGDLERSIPNYRNLIFGNCENFKIYVPDKQLMEYDDKMSLVCQVSMSSELNFYKLLY